MELEDLFFFSLFEGLQKLAMKGNENIFKMKMGHDYKKVENHRARLFNSFNDF